MRALEGLVPLSVLGTLLLSSHAFRHNTELSAVKTAASISGQNIYVQSSDNCAL
jgi:hypothetical protein